MTGDFIAQTMENSRDLKRSARFFVFGSVFVGPSLAIWYRLLNKLPKTNTGLFSKVALDQFVWSPVGIAFFFGMQGALQGISVDESFQKLKLVYWDVLKTNWTVWPAIQFINFYMVPVNYQSVVVNTVAIGWNAYLSRTNSRADSIHNRSDKTTGLRTAEEDPS
jgi:protein Mpv17